MVKVIRREVRRRGFFGWVFLVIFLLFNALMLFWLVRYWSAVSELYPQTPGAEQTGAGIGAAIGTGTIMFVWTMGSVVTGLLALITRGRKTIVEEIEN